MGVASEADPPEFQGFTHLLEHMLFTGSKDFPEDNYIEKVVNKYNGSNNGGTGDFTTTYYYELEEEGFDEFLPILADAIKNPNFDIENIRKEVNNINSEISMRMTFEKKYKYYKFIKAIGNPKSRLFSDGFNNVDASAINFEQLREQLIEFHQKYYTGNLMKITVISDKNANRIFQEIEDNFEDIPRGEVPRPFFNTTDTYTPPISDETFGRMYFMKGEVEPSVLRIINVFDSFRKETLFLPDDFLNLLFNYKAKGSLKYKLEEENLVTDIHSYQLFEDFKDQIFVFEFQLTEEGQKKISRVMYHFYNFIDSLKKLENRKEIYDYISTITKYGFLYNVGNSKLGISEDNNDYFSKVGDISEFMQDFNTKDLYTANAIFDYYDDNRFLELLGKITPEKSIFLFDSKNFKVNDELKNKVIEVKPKQPEVLKAKFNPGEQIGDKHTEIKVEKEIDIDKRKIPKKIEDKKNNTRVLTEESGKKSNLWHPLQSKGKKDDDSFQETKGGSNDNIEINQKEAEPINYNTPEQQQKYFDDVLDSAVDTVLLDDEFEFDGGTAFKVIQLDLTVLKTLERDVADENLEYTIVQPSDTEYTEHYSIISKCVAPPELRGGIVEINSKAPNYTFFKGDIKKLQLKRLYSDKDNKSYIHTPKVYNTIMNRKKDDDDLMYKLDLYKYCLNGDFKVDDTEARLIKLQENLNSSLNYKLFRKSMQPKFISIITIESDFLLRNILVDKEAQNNTALMVDMLCSYLNRYIELEFHEDYMKGNQFNCKRMNYELIFIFNGISSLVKDFSLSVLDHVKGLHNNPGNFDEMIIKNVRRVYRNYYSNFNIKTSQDIASYYLDVLMNKLSIDYASTEKHDKLINLVNAVDDKVYSELIDSIFQKPKITISNIGNVTTKTSEQMLEHVKDNFTRGKTGFHAAFDNSKLRSSLIGNLVMKFNLDEHVVVRLPNNNPMETNTFILLTLSLIC